MSKVDDVLRSPRRRVRYVYVRDAWPECPADMDPSEAILAAPDEAVIAALTREVEKYAEVIHEERTLRRDAERKLETIARAALVVGYMVKGLA